MKNSTLNRSMLSGENMALLAELKSQNEEFVVEDNDLQHSTAPKTKQDELDFLWQNFRISTKEEKSPGIYILAGFIAGALSMFLMTAMLSITTFSEEDGSAMAKQERKIIKKDHGSFNTVASSDAVANVNANAKESSVDLNMAPTTSVITEKYTVKAGDSLEAISVKYYGKATPENTAKIQAANELASPHAIYAGQELVIPLN